MCIFYTRLTNIVNLLRFKTNYFLKLIMLTEENDIFVSKMEKNLPFM